MKIRKVIAMGVMTAVFASSALGVSAAEKISKADVNALKESGKISLILDVDAYKAAYGDLEAAFGDNVDAYIEHYLTVGVYEGRNKGVLFDPLAYAEAYGDVGEAFGNDISAIVNHYVTFGAAEKRTAGTANGYADLAVAQKNGAATQRSSKAVSLANSVMANAGNAVSSQSGMETVTGNGGMDAGSDSNSMMLNAGNAAGSNNTAGSSSNSAAAGNNTAESSNSAAASNSSAESNKNYHHTTSIYDNDEKTLIRVEYYDENNKLFQYSEVTDYDSETNSYKETIYNASDMGVDRTDTYENGSLSSSEKN